MNGTFDKHLHACTNLSSIFYCNSRSLKNKINDLNSLVAIHSPSIIAITETWLDSEFPSSLLQLDSYDIYRHDRDSHGGGVLIAVNKLINSSRVDFESQSELVSVDVNLNRTIRLIVAYNPDRLNLTRVDAFFADLTTLTRCRCPCVVLGDFNMPGVDWNEPRFPDSSVYNSFAEYYFQSQPISQLNTTPTRENNVLDLLFVTDMSVYSSHTTLPPLSSSDHDAMIVKLCLYLQSRKSSSVRDFRSKNIDNVISYLSDANLSVKNSPNSSEASVCFFDQINTAISKFLPLRRVKRSNSKRYNDRTSQKLYRAMNRLYRKTRKRNDEITRLKYAHAKSAFRKHIRHRKIKFEQNIIKKWGINKFYSYVSKLYSDKSQITSITCINGEKLVEALDIANALNDYFVSVFNRSDVVSVVNVSNSCKIQITAQMIQLAFNSINLSTAAGVDSIPMYFWKSLLPIIENPLAELFTRFVNDGFVPDYWKRSAVVPIYKGKGDRSSPSNYRPISLTPTISRVFERVLLQIIEPVFKHVIHEHQFGFRAGRSTESNLLCCYANVTSMLDSGASVDIVFLDLAKAFDKVDHSLLVNKLLISGLHLRVVRVLREFLVNRIQRVRVGSTESNTSSVTSGVPQGTVLGPYLFSLFINDLLCLPFENTVLAFADDLKLYGSNPDSIQRDLNRIQQWCAENRMLLNVSKCNVLYLGKHNSKHNYTLGSDAFVASECERDLGVMIDSDMSFATHINKVRQKSYFLINSLFRVLNIRNKNTLVSLFKQFVRPTIEYCSSVYFPRHLANLNKIEQIQRYFTRRIYNNSNIRPIYLHRLRKLGLDSLEFRFIQHDLITIYKLKSKRLVIPGIDLPFSRNPHSQRATRFVVPKCKSHFASSFFLSRSIKYWNMLPASIQNQKSLSLFKSALCKFDHSKLLKGRALKA